MKDKQSDEDKGVKAIIALQKLAGIDEPEDRARRNWQAFSEHDKENTLGWFGILCKEQVK